jgi:hypothetical protein
MVVSAIAEGPPKYKYAKGARSGHSGEPLCGLLLGGVPVPLAGGVASAQLGRHETAHLRTPLLYAPLRHTRSFEGIEYLSFAAIARN